MNHEILKDKPWWGYLEEDLQELLTEALLLLRDASTWKIKFHDYAFIVFPAAKAYEGFLKKLFFDLDLISEADYYGKRFRIGKSLNPHLDEQYQDESWVYDDLIKFCGGGQVPNQLWKAWINCRNQLFHWFPHEQKAIDIAQAQERITMIIDAVDSVYAKSQVKLNK
jgi:hypothetical protein